MSVQRTTYFLLSAALLVHTAQAVQYTGEIWNQLNCPAGQGSAYNETFTGSPPCLNYDNDNYSLAIIEDGGSVQLNYFNGYDCKGTVNATYTGTCSGCINFDSRFRFWPNSQSVTVNCNAASHASPSLVVALSVILLVLGLSA